MDLGKRKKVTERKREEFVREISTAAEYLTAADGDVMAFQTAKRWTLYTATRFDNPLGPTCVCFFSELVCHQVTVLRRELQLSGAIPWRPTILHLSTPRFDGETLLSDEE